MDEILSLLFVILFSFYFIFLFIFLVKLFSCNHIWKATFYKNKEVWTCLRCNKKKVVKSDQEGNSLSF